jgi:hypothetical protein
MSCSRRNVIQIKKRDGTRLTATRCACPSALLFTQDVTDEQCNVCSNREEVPVPPMPKPAQRLFTWAKAVTGWVAAGRPERSEEEVVRIYQTVCAGTPVCDWFNLVKQTCNGCGCRVAAGGSALVNKIKMATQHCPRGRW